MTSRVDAYGRDIASVEAARRWASERTPAELREALAAWTSELETRALVGDEALRFEAAAARAEALGWRAPA